MPLYASGDVLLNVADLASGNDGNGSGSTPTTAPGAVVSVPERSEVGLLLMLSQPTTDPPADAATLDVGVEVSVDGGSSWKDLVDFRQVLGSELPDDEDAGDPGLKMAFIVRLPEADADQSGLVQLRPVTAASTTTDWGAFLAVVPVQSNPDSRRCS